MSSYSEAMTTPTEPGWYAFDGFTNVGITQMSLRGVYSVHSHDGFALAGCERGTYVVSEMHGKWYRLHMPWDAAPVDEGAPQWELDFPPEWDRHPWANWACLIVAYGDFDGVTLRWEYYQDKPQWGKKSYNWVSGTHGFTNPVKRAPLSLFFDTKDTLRQRPPRDEVNHE